MILFCFIKNVYYRSYLKLRLNYEFKKGYETDSSLKQKVLNIALNFAMTDHVTIVRSI